MDPPVPIPNTDVKRASSKDTWRVTAWKNSPLPGFTLNQKALLSLVERLYSTELFAMLLKMVNTDLFAMLMNRINTELFAMHMNMI